MRAKHQLDMMEASWLLMDSRLRQMHVATLLIYELPEDADRDYLSQLVSDLREETEFVDPFNKRLVKSSLGILPFWVIDSDLDMEYHVRHQALPYPGGERELGMLISRLHSNPMDKERPLWEFHIIEGLENNRFAVYFKMHHALVDGIAGVRMLQRTMSTDPSDLDLPALWAASGGSWKSKKLKFTPDSIKQSLKKGSKMLSSVAPAMGRLGKMLGASFDEDDPITLPFQTPVSKLNTRIHSQRRFATQLYDFERIRALSKAADCTVNDIVLALCSGALRKFLRELCALPGEPLTAGVPVSLRTPEDQGSGTAVSYIMANLGTNIADPIRRLETIKASTQRGKSMLQGLSKESIDIFTNTLMSPFSLQTATGLDGRTRPVFNLTISNVPGPREPLFFRGAKLEAMYPVSAVTHGQALNITCYSYAGTLSFGFAACRDTLPRIQRLAVYTGESLEELEHAVFEKHKPKRKAKTEAEPAPSKISRVS